MRYLQCCTQVAALAVHKLEGQLGAAKAALKERLEQLRELDAQVFPLSARISLL